MRLLILHSEPSDFREYLAQYAGDHEIEWATTVEEVGPALRRCEPEVVFSIKHSGFPGPAHQQALEWPSVRWFQVGGSGTDHLHGWNPLSTTVTNSLGTLARFHAERALAGLLALSTGLLKSQRAQAEKRWEPTRFRSLAGRTLLIVGAGHTGSALASLVRPLGLRVLGVRRRPSTVPPEFDEMHLVETLDDLWERADVVSLNVPAGPETEHLVNVDILRKLPQGALLLNGARGSVVDTEALLDALRTGRLGGAWMDVFEQEPLPASSPLWEMTNVIISPHSADQVHDFPLRFAQRFVENLRRYEAGTALENVVEVA